MNGWRCRISAHHLLMLQSSFFLWGPSCIICSCSSRRSLSGPIILSSSLSKPIGAASTTVAGFVHAVSIFRLGYRDRMRLNRFFVLLLSLLMMSLLLLYPNHGVVVAVINVNLEIRFCCRCCSCCILSIDSVTCICIPPTIHRRPLRHHCYLLLGQQKRRHCCLPW